MKKQVRLVLWCAICAATIHCPSFAQTRSTGPENSPTAANVSPRSDFYQYANSGALKHRVATSTNDEVLNKHKRLNDEAASRKSRKGSDEQLVGDFWFTGLDAETLNREGIAPLRPQFDLIDKIDSKRGFMDAVADLNMETRLDTFLFWALAWPDDYNSERLMYHLHPGGLSGGMAPYTGTGASAEKTRAAYRTYLYKTFFRLYNSENEAQESADAVFDLEARMARAVGNGKEYQLISLAELGRLTPSIDWARYFKRIGLKRTDALVMRGSAFFRNLDELIRTVPLSTWKDYLRLRLLRANVAYLDDRTLEDFFQYDRMYTGAARPRDRWQRVIRHMEPRVGGAMGRRYVKANDLGKVRARYRAMAEGLRAAFRERIKNLVWMSTKTKDNALNKLASMRLTIGYGDRFADLSAMDITRDVYVLNILRANRWLNAREIKSVGTKPDRTPEGLARGDAEYNPWNNEAVLPLNFMETSVGAEWDDAYIYGRIGATFGHEMSHGFDSNGRHHGATGTKTDWWTQEDSAAFEERAKSLIELYSEFMPIDGIRLNGQRTLAENMSDLTGVLIALDAYRQTDQFKKNEMIDGFTPLQRFFLAFANQAQQTQQEIAGRLQFGVHSPNKERVNGTLMNVPEFYQAFDIRPGDPMYRPEEKRARIW